MIISSSASYQHLPDPGFGAFIFFIRFQCLYGLKDILNILKDLVGIISKRTGRSAQSFVFIPFV